MKNSIKFPLFFIFFWLIFFRTEAQETIKPSLSEIGESKEWKVNNREAIKKDEGIYLNKMPGNGIVWNDEIVFSNGVIEVDLKGKDIRGESFIGIAFHVQNDSTYEAIYFRPFNFQNPERNGHSIQYISHPVFTWDKLRNEHPEVYESTIDPIPDPNEWFHARIEVNYPEVKVFVNDSDVPSFEVKQIGKQKKGNVGIWVGNYSDGSFKNLSIQPKK
jgi:hypothetical protein